MEVFIGIIILAILAIPMVAHYHRKAVQESFDASVSRLEGQAKEEFIKTRWDGR